MNAKLLNLNIILFIAKDMTRLSWKGLTNQRPQTFCQAHHDYQDHSTSALAQVICGQR